MRPDPVSPGAWIRLWSVGFAAAALSGCASLERVLGFEEQMERARAFAHIGGSVRSEADPDAPLVVVLAREGEDGLLVGVDSFTRRGAGSYSFAVSAGRYRLGAYADRDGNGMLDPGENTLPPAEGPRIEVGPGADLQHSLVIAAGVGTPPDVVAPVDVLGVVARTPREQAHFSLWAWSVQGELCRDLGDPRFGPEAGQQGLWEVTDFVLTGLAGIHFLEPYDPARVPVLFVHGIGGSPQDFRALIGSLDRSRYQPWFHFYPSGFSLDRLASHLATLLARLQLEHGFDELAVVAHSMGGLVSRGAILEYARETGRDDVRLFVAISTPWGGHASATGSAEAPIALPLSFHDMDPSSAYLRRLFHDDARGGVRELPRGAEQHLLIGYRMDGLADVANDGVVSVASQARAEAQDQASSVRAFDRGHVEILAAPEVLARVEALLAERFP